MKSEIKRMQSGKTIIVACTQIQRIQQPEKQTIDEDTDETNKKYQLLG